MMPPIGLLTNNDFSHLKIHLKNGTDGSEVAIKYGVFITDIINFLIIAFCVFLIITIISKLWAKKEEEALLPKEPPAQEKLLGEIRDILKSRPSI